MKYIGKLFFLSFSFLSVLSLSLVSCVNTKKAVYFDNIQDTVLNNPDVNIEPIITINDLLNITVSSLNPDASMVFNSPNIMNNIAASSTGTTSAGVPQFIGYLVSGEGTVNFPVLGSLKAAGLTRKQLEQEITTALTERKLLVGAIVNVRFLNFRVTVLGEVNRPTTINVVNEKISLLEALGLSGDVTIYAKRDNVLLIREEGNKKIIRRIDLNSSKVLTSPYYYLKTNDVVYVEPIKSKIAATNRTQQLLPIILSGLSLVAAITLHYVN